MRCIDRMTVSSRVELSLEAFLFEHLRTSEVCHRLDSSPGALILDNLVANRWPGEAFDAWLYRQVTEVLVQHVQTDDWQGEPGAWEGTRTQSTVENILFDDQDREWLLIRFGQHPEVLSIWAEVCRQEPAQQLAA